MDGVAVTRGGRCGPQRVPEAEGAAVRGRPLVAGAGPASLRAARQPGQAPGSARGALLALAGARVKMSVREPSSTPGPWGAPPACPPGFLVCPAVVTPPPRRPLLALGSTTLWAPGDPMAAATSLASESPFHVACVHVCVGHTHRHDTAVISAGKLLPQMATRSPPRSWRSLLPGGAADASPERTARPCTPPPRPAQPPPSRGIGRRPLPHPGTRRRRAGSRTPRSRVAAGEREDPSSYGEGPARPLKRVRPEGCGHAPGTEARFPGKDHTEDRTSGSCHASHPRAGSQFTHIKSCHRDPWDRHSEKCSPSEVGRKGQAHREMLRTGPVRASQAPLQGRRQPL